nr:MAG TPA: hypothetical protein [Caudoviricetes sp.]DAX60105.1 MAG TPA: hypothetical protein [Caudoviricetes sp.]
MVLWIIEEGIYEVTIQELAFVMVDCGQMEDINHSARLILFISLSIP